MATERLDMALVRRAIPEVDTATFIHEEQPEAQEDFETASVRDLLIQVQDLYNVRDPANERIGRIKSALIGRLSPIYDEKQQLNLFDDLSGLAFRDPKDQEQVIIQHPDVPLQFRMKRTHVTRWKEIMRSVSQEAERRRIELERLEALSEMQLTEEDRLRQEYLRGYIDSLEWMVEQPNVRHNYRLDGRFVAASHAPQD